jgi:hypothetical protein
VHRLRHPIRSITEPYGKAGLTLAILALVMAMVGGAYAAGGLTKSQEKQVTKIAKKYAGKPGAPGAPGAAGTNGTNGKDGTNGTNGTNGVSAEATSFTGTKTVGSVKCENGGAVVKSASPETAVCNGKNGTTGFTETLPSGKTLQGDWSIVEAPSSNGALVNTSLSFGIPLAAAPAVHYIKAGVTNATGTGDVTTGNQEITNVTVTSGEFTVGASIFGAGIPAGATIERVEEISPGVFTLHMIGQPTATGTGVELTAGLPKGCIGNAEEPGAEPGNLCVYAHEENGGGAVGLKICSNGTEGFGCVLSPGSNPPEADTFGFGLWGESKASFYIADGTWAVTAG